MITERTVIKIYNTVMTCEKFAKKYANGNFEKAKAIIEVLINKGSASICDNTIQQTEEISTNLEMLKKNIETTTDEVVYDFLVYTIGDKLMCTVISDAIYQSIKVYSRSNHEILVSRLNIGSMNQDSFGVVGAATAISVLLVNLNNRNPSNEMKSAIQSLTIATASYLSQQIVKSEYLRYVWDIQEKIRISDKFYNGLVDYYSSYIQQITSQLAIKLNG